MSAVELPAVTDVEAENHNIPDDFFYEKSALKVSLQDYEMSRDLVAVHHIFSAQHRKRNNMHYIAQDVLMYIAANAVVFLDLTTMKRRYVFGLDGGGIGSVAVHPSKQFFALAEKGTDPNIYIYEYPSFRVYRICRKGTERSYSHVNFSSNGDKMASVGGYPDFMLTVWDWRQERIILRTKAFGQEVFNVQFSPDNDGRLTTSGSGHIRFWKMASTFTGLKLQGDIGKFGKVELSDIPSFAEFPDGKVLSGTESGALLLWDGNFIKCKIMRKDGVLPHEGLIGVVLLLKREGLFVTGGADGYVRWWVFSELDTADLNDDALWAEVEPARETLVGENVAIVDMHQGAGHWLLQDANGYIWKMTEPGNECTKIMSFHAGPINGLDASPADHFAATCGEDGTVRLWDYVERTELFVESYNSPGSSLVWAPSTVDAQARTIAVGFGNGVVRILLRAAEKWKRLHVFKPHNARVTCLQFSPDGRHLCTGGADGIVFLLAVTVTSNETGGGGGGGW